MEAELTAKKIGGSLVVILPRDLIEKANIRAGDILMADIKKKTDLSWLWGKGKDIRKSTETIMREIDEGEE